MRNKISLLAIVLITTILLTTIAFVLNIYRTKIVIVANFDECANAGFEILETYPRQCRTKNGVVFTEQTFDVQKPDKEIIFCTADAKVCPDGSYVGRDSNNNCEFKPCP